MVDDKRSSRRRPPRPGSLAGIHNDATCRLQQALHSGAQGERGRTADDRLLLLAEQRVRRRVWLRKTLPLNLVFLLPGILFIGTRSRTVLALFVATYPLMFVVRALLARGLSAWIGSEDVLVRNEYEKLL